MLALALLCQGGMTRILRSTLPCLLLLAACHTPIDPLPEGAPEVEASLSAVTLADDCPDAAQAAQGDSASGACESPDDCAPLCSQSNLQIELRAGDGTTALGFSIVEVRVIDESARKATVVTRAPQRWDGATYVAWDERIAPAATLKVSYKISELVSPNDDGTRLRAVNYSVEVDVFIGGVKRTLSLDGVTREPAVAT